MGGRRVVSTVDGGDVSVVGSVDGSVMVIVGSVNVTRVDDVVAEDEVDDVLGVEVVVELEVDDDVVEADVVDPGSVRVPPRAVARLLKSTRVTSGRSTVLVPGIVLSSSGTVDEGKTSVRVSPVSEPMSSRPAINDRTTSNPSGITLFSIGCAPNVPSCLLPSHPPVSRTPSRCTHGTPLCLVSQATKTS